MAEKDEEQSEEPVWLSPDYDHLHKPVDETEPLFGSGKIPLEGEGNDDKQDGDVESQSHYGSTESWQAKPSSTVSPVPSSKSGGGLSKGSNAKKGPKKKKEKKKKPPPPPPKSIFDEPKDDENDGSAFSDDDNDTDLTLETKPHMPQRNWCLDFFRLVSAVTTVSSLALLATQLIPLFLAPNSQGYFDVALKVYCTLFCFLFIFVECDVPIPVIRESDLLQTYVSRGFLYSFLGLICLQEAYSERVKEMVKVAEDEFHVAWASLFMQISSWLIFSCGLLYMLMGLCCLKKLRDRIRKKDRIRWQKYRKELKRWKRENGI